MSSSLRNSMLKKIQAIIHPRCHVSLRFRFCNCFPFTFTLLSVSAHHCLLIVKCFALFTWPSLTKKRASKKANSTKQNPSCQTPNFVHYWQTLLTVHQSWRQRGVPLELVPCFWKTVQNRERREAGEMERDGNLRALAYFTTVLLSRQFQSVVNLLVLGFLKNVVGNIDDQWWNDNILR